jgi:predicted MPP superfamily phosphohydrolase
MLGVSLSAVACPGLYATGIEPYWLQIVNRPLPISHLPASLIGRTLTHISDAHLSLIADTNYLIAAFRHVVGYLIPIHFNVRPEITLFELTAA